MTTPSLRIEAADISEERFSRFRLLRWWNQERIRSANILVIGAGALGNEILKNLALLGFERVVVADCDTIEASNLARSVLYRPADIGGGKAPTAAAAYRAIYDQATVVPLTANVLFDLGVGIFDWADLVIAGLDNREARLWINQCCWKMNKPWIDGAIESLNGVARVFLPGEPPCYECTLGETDWGLINRRMSCNLLTVSEMSAGKVPTTPTTAAVIAGIQVQEALKYLHDMPVLKSRGFVFDGLMHTSYVVEYTENPECFAHHVHSEIVRLPQTSDELTLDELYAIAKQQLRADRVVVEFSREIIQTLECPLCGQAEDCYVAVGTIDFEAARCPRDGATRTVHTIRSYSGTEPYGTVRLRQLGLPEWDAYVARSGDEEIAFLIAGDAVSVIGKLARGAPE